MPQAARAPFMSTIEATIESTSARTLTFAAYISFIPIGIATVLLGPMLPTLSARWSLNYAQAGALFTAQYLASTCGVAVSGVLASRWGFRFAIKIGLVLMAAALALLLAGPEWMGIACIAASGAGMGLAVPAANLLVAATNPDRRSAALNVLNFYWSVGAVACPFLVATAAKINHIPLFLMCVSAFSLALAAAIARMPAHINEPALTSNPGPMLPQIRRRLFSFIVLAVLFFLYVGVENAFGQWIASYSKSLGSLSLAVSLATPACFYAALTLGRWLAPLLLKLADEILLVRVGLLLSCAGMAGLMFSKELVGVVASGCAAGLGLSYVYPITISILSKEFASPRVGSFMFVLSNIGGGLLPWMVGIFSTRFGTLKAGLCVALLGCSAMFALYLGKWTQADQEMSTRFS
jgi:MFS transporter, FHS family, glucose/mannose:H+ symporter